jgi:hypothetical protein
MVDQLLVQVMPLETQVGFFSSTITDTTTKGDFQRQNTWLNMKLEGESSLLFSISSSDSLTDLYVLLAVVEAELKTLKIVSKNVVKYFYP